VAVNLLLTRWMQTKETAPAGFNMFFHRFAHLTALAMGSPWAFIFGILLVFVWGATGRYFHYSDTWQLVINTGTTIVTFLMVFLIQHSQNRDAKITQMKLDELIRAVGRARTDLIQMEKLPDDELTAIESQMEKQREKAVRQRRRKA